MARNVSGAFEKRAPDWVVQNLIKPVTQVKFTVLKIVCSSVSSLNNLKLQISSKKNIFIQEILMLRFAFKSQR